MAGTRRAMVGRRGGHLAGTRGGVGRIAAMAVGLVVLICLLLAGTARAGTYKVAQCGWGIGAELDPAAPKTEGEAVFLHPGYCTAPPAGSPAGLWFGTGFAPDGAEAVARARWVAPPGTNFAAVRFTWSGELPWGFWQVASYDDGVEVHGLVGDVIDNAPHPVAADITGPAPAFEVDLECLIHGGPVDGCHRSQRSSLLLSGLTLTVDDPVPPRAKLSGAMADGGWHRGTVPLEIAGEDAIGAGVAREEAMIDGAPVLNFPQACAVATIEGEVRGTLLRPCPPTAAQSGAIDTTRLADGVHTLRGCAIDLGGGRGCAPDAQIEVDNSGPEVDFAAAPEGQVAANVSDPYSGPAAGTISMRRADAESWTDLQTTFTRDGSGTATLTAALPDLSAGAYFFRAAAIDGAGNGGSAQFRAAGSAAEVRRQVAAASGDGRGPAPRGGRRTPGGHGRSTRLVAYLVRDGGGARGDRGQRRPVLADLGSLRPGAGGSRLTVDYGSAVEVRGWLTDSHGGAVAERPVTIVARAAAGSGHAPERRRVVTDHAGRFALHLSPGTSRRVVVAFHGGGGFAPARGRSLALRVRAAVTLVASPLHLDTGESVTFTGAVRHGPVRIAARGKLVTVQYLERATGLWRPALVVRTDRRGRFKVGYRFRYITGAARIRLRATALPEAGWPYASGSSAPVTVTVHGR